MLLSVEEFLFQICDVVTGVSFCARSWQKIFDFIWFISLYGCILTNSNCQLDPIQSQTESRSTQSHCHLIQVYLYSAKWQQ